MKENEALTYVFTGEGKGKTSAALGTVLRAAIRGEEVCWIALYKQESWGIVERELGKKFPKVEMHLMGKGFRIVKPEEVKRGVKLATVGKTAKVVDTASEEEHRAAAQEAVKLAQEKLSTGRYFVVVLDEVLNAVPEGLVEEEAVLEVMRNKGRTHLILTGRGATEKIIEAADLVTECRKVKHPYDSGKLAVRGLDY